MATHVDQCKMLRLPIGKPLDYNDLSTARLRALSSFAGHGDSGTTDRSALLISLSNDVRAEAGNPWTIQNAQGVAPARMFGAMFSFEDELYLYGGLPTKKFLYESDLTPAGPFSSGEDHFMMKLDKDTHAWGPISYAGAARETWRLAHLQSKGIVHQDRFFLTGTGGHYSDDMRIFDFKQQKWTLLPLGITPPARIEVLLGAYDSMLIQFGGRDRETPVGPTEALWTFDIMDHTWQPRFPSGPLPPPDMACGLAIANGCAYVLINHPDMLLDNELQMEVYELDLATWHWRILPCQGDAAFCATNMTPVVVEGQWVMHGGDPAVAGDTLEMFTFDFSNLSWSQAKLTGSPLQHRISYAATCHQGAMVVMAGVLPKEGLAHFEAAEVVQCIRPRPVPLALDTPETSLMRYDMARQTRGMFQRSEFTDMSVVTEDKTWQAHRVVLASASSVFRESFVIDKESELQQGTHKLVLSQVTAETVDLMLDWLYGAFQASLSLPQIVALFQASHMFAITQLEAQCVEALKVFMSSQTCLQLADLAIEHHCPTLTEACKSFLQQLESQADNSGLAQAVRASLGFEPLVPVPANADGTVAEVDLPAHPAPNMGMPAVEPEPCVTTVDTAGLPAPHHEISSHPVGCFSHPVGCFSHPVGCFSHPVGCFSHPILDWEEDDEWDIPHPDGDTPTTNAGNAGPITDEPSFSGHQEGAESSAWAAPMHGHDSESSGTAHDNHAGPSHLSETVVSEVPETSTAHKEVPEAKAGARLSAGEQLPSGFSLGRLGRAVAKSAVKMTVGALATVAVVAVADKQCHMAKRMHQLPRNPSFW